jgi:hypothetical protein
MKGKPLYYWAKDTKPGDKTGDNVGERSGTSSSPDRNVTPAAGFVTMAAGFTDA